MKRISKKRIKVLQNVADSEIDYSDIGPLTNEFWKHAQIAQIELPQPREGVYLKVRADTLDWFRSQGRGYQAMIEKVLTSYVEYQKQHASGEDTK